MSLPIDYKVLWEEGQDLAEDLADAGANEDKVAEAVAHFLDAIVPMNLLVPGLPGVILEAKDGDIFEAAIKAIRDLLRSDPEKREARRERRTRRRAARREARRG